ncbi:MAG: UDP-galactopyranose mutase [Erysipelotrichaceae bacterium]|nr:UDP-galactopyranose mutase [Erysipelotrichaceae bacterium]
MYDYLIVGSGLFGAVFAHEMHEAGKKVLIVEKRSHIGGNIYTEEIEDITVHKYGAHIFHTSSKEVWDYVNRFVPFNDYVHHVKASYKGEIYDLPFNMHTFQQMWGINDPEEAQRIIQSQQGNISEIHSLEEQCISMVGTDIYEKLVKGYTEKQWGRECKDLPAFIIRRLPVRFSFDNNYFNDPYQGIPETGYTALIEKLLEGIEVVLEHDFLKQKNAYAYKKLVYTGPIDAYYDYCFGALAYRSLRFETELLDRQDYQGIAVVNYTDKETPYTRIIEHKHFVHGRQKKTVITREYPKEWKQGDEPYYPINDETNETLYQKYKQLAEQDPNVIFGGRLGEYRYYDMDKVIEKALSAAEEELHKTA